MRSQLLSAFSVDLHICCPSSSGNVSGCPSVELHASPSHAPAGHRKRKNRASCRMRPPYSNGSEVSRSIEETVARGRRGAQRRGAAATSLFCPKRLDFRKRRAKSKSSAEPAAALLPRDTFRRMSLREPHVLFVAGNCMRILERT